LVCAHRIVLDICGNSRWAASTGLRFRVELLYPHMKPSSNLLKPF
jgi:hypothetical protein